MKKSIKSSTAILRYPYIGQITRCTDRGFGFVNFANKDEMLHLSDHSGHHLNTMEGLEGKYCAFVIGGHPFRYANKRPGWEESVVQWILLDDLDKELTPEIYCDEREKVLLAQGKGHLHSTLSAEWYSQLWQRKTGGKTKAVLKADTLLDNALESFLAECDGIEELIQLLGDIIKSPWYGVDGDDRARICRRFFRPDDWPLSVFLVSGSLNSCRGYNDVWPLCGEELENQIRIYVEDLENRIRKARTVAIDLESNKKSIFQFGWKNADGTDMRSDPDGLSSEKLREAAEACVSAQESPCIVGHNLLSWDWPILQQHEVPFPMDSVLWDTLVAAWILEPWNDSHALVVKENAHQADADAEACYELFERQIAQLTPCLTGTEYDLPNLVDKLFEDPSLLTEVQGREYPGDLYDRIPEPCIYPKNRVSETIWQKNCHLELVAPETNLSNPILSPKLCRVVAANQGGVLAKTVSLVVSDAATNGVEVRLSLLPPWLADDELQSALKHAHDGAQSTEENANSRFFYLAEDLFKLTQEDLEKRLAGKKVTVAHWGDVLAAWQNAYRRVFTEQEVQSTYPGAIEGRTGRVLLPVTREDRNARWLLYEPPGLGETGAAWSLLPNPPGWLHSVDRSAQDKSDKTDWACLPRWKDGDASRLDTDRLFVSPDTANRLLHLSDVTLCILNLLEMIPEEEVLLISMRWQSEAKQLQRNLVRLSLSTQHSDSPLRQLEHVCNNGFRVLACDRINLSKYMQAADRLGKNVLVAVDEIPLHNWHALLNPPESRTAASLDAGITDIPGERVEQDDSKPGKRLTEPANLGQQTAIKGQDIQEAVSVFLLEWVRGLLNTNDAPAAPVLIMDARLFSHHAARATQIPMRDIPFYSLEELLDADAQQVFYEVCYPRREPKSIPNDYESYRLFLKENWGYDDFRPGTQKPAIEKLIQTNRDILLRLPTGEGKSIIFHLPALLRAHYSGRLTIVVTPLRALMRDQVEGLWEKHFTESVDYLSGGRDAWMNYEVYQGILDGRIKLVFVAPERFRVPRFTEAIERRRRMDNGLEFVVFDETHCISEWGFEFRPDYLYAAQYVAEWFKEKDLPGNPHRLLLTSATVTQRNRADLEKELRLGKQEAYEDLPEDMPHPIQPYIMLQSFDLHENEEAADDQKFEKIIEILDGLDLNQSAAILFVRRRIDCHRLSEALNEHASRADSSLATMHALPFHAGLAETVKAETSDLLKDRKANVLVCTKAFGMGMDIPHLHACIHHRPPTFIEDYLQEVGRIGRDEEKRMRSGHERVTATLLYNQHNIEQNLELLHDSSVKPPDLQDFFGFCQETATPIEENGKSICIVPANVRLSETKGFNENQVTNCLFWLERMQVLRVEGRRPPFLDLTLELAKLRDIAGESTKPSRIATVLLEIVDESRSTVNKLAQTPPKHASDSGAETVFNRIIKGLLGGVMALISPTKTMPAEKQSPGRTSTSSAETEDGRIKLSVPMSELTSACGDLSLDDIFTGLFELSSADALSVRKHFVIMKYGVPSTDEYWNLLKRAVERLLQPTAGGVELLPRKQFEAELKEWYRDYLRRDAELSEAKGQDIVPTALAARRIQREVYRAIATSLRIMRYAGLELRESLSSDGIAQYARSIPDSMRSKAARSADESILAIRGLLDCVSAHETPSSQLPGMTFKLELTDIMDALGPEMRVSRLKEVMKLVESSGFYSFGGSLSEWVSIVTLYVHQPLEPHTPDSVGNPDIQATYAEMLGKYELQVLRAQSMILLAAMPAEDRKQFIDRYFECVNAQELQRLLEDTVGDVDDEVLAMNPMLQELLSQVRHERFSEEIEKLNDDQLGVCKATFNTNLLVNAGPGSGKTHVLMMRCAHLIHVQRIDPAEILVLAFNRAVVYEIRDRIRDLFRALGYGRYANRLDVSTFHSFALRHQQTTDLYEEDAIGQAVHRFAEIMTGDEEFARRIGGRYKAILVDEFQDMNEDFYAAVKNLIKYCSGGGMVIGDDDQDILTWNRRDWQKKHRQDCPLEAVHYFNDFQKSLTPEEHQLVINYRSVPEVVQRANGMIAKVSERVGFYRMKNDRSLSAYRVDRGIVELPFDSDNSGQLAREALKRNERTAILCRSNKECRQIYEKLTISGDANPNQIDLLGSEDFALYQLRHCGAMMDICRNRNEYDFVESYVWDDLLQEYVQLQHADANKDVKYLEMLYMLIREEAGRPRMRDIQNFIQEMRTSDVERLKAKTGFADKRPKLTISTVHKVKGLEYETVLVMPSIEKFPFRGAAGNLTQTERVDAAEEARLCYVAMTRARNNLYVGWGERENKWLNCSSFMTKTGYEQYSLKGSPKELFVSWSGQSQQVQMGLQDYIEKHVCLSDTLTLQYGKQIFHNNHHIARLSNPTAMKVKQTDANLRVSNIIRYTCGSYFREHNPGFWEKLDDRVKQQGWFYIVLAEVC